MPGGLAPAPGTGMAMTSMLCRAMTPLALAATLALPAYAQPNPACPRLEAQLQNFDRGGGDPARADQIRRYQEAATGQQGEIERQQTLARRMGCGNGGFFVLFSNEPAQCGPQNAKIQQMRANLDKIHSDLASLERGGSGDRDGQRQAILMALAQNNCGPQYQTAAAAQPQRGGGLFESLFGRGSVFSGGDSAPGGNFRTLCVRTCDGYFYPISFSTSSDRFAEDEKACRNSCPAAEVMLFAHRNPGEDVSQAVSTGGQLYSSLPNAFRFRQAFDSGCSCRRPGESWANALKNADDSIESGDIVVNEQRARQLSQPVRDAQGRPIAASPAPRPATRAATSAVPPAAAPAAEAKSEDAAPSPATPVKPDPNRTVRAVGPTFLPAR